MRLNCEVGILFYMMKSWQVIAAGAGVHSGLPHHFMDSRTLFLLAALFCGGFRSALLGGCLFGAAGFSCHDTSPPSENVMRPRLPSSEYDHSMLPVKPVRFREYNFRRGFAGCSEEIELRSFQLSTL
jgi:hypothetical protein